MSDIKPGLDYVVTHRLSPRVAKMLLVIVDLKNEGTMRTTYEDIVRLTCESKGNIGQILTLLQLKGCIRKVVDKGKVSFEFI